MILQPTMTKQQVSQVLFGDKGDVHFSCPYVPLVLGIEVQKWNKGEKYKTLGSIFGEEYQVLVLDSTREEQFLTIKTIALKNVRIKEEEIKSRLRMLQGKLRTSPIFILENWKSPVSVSYDSVPIPFNNALLSYDIGSKCFVQYSSKEEERHLNRLNEEQISRIKAVALPTFGIAEKNYGRDITTKYLGLDGRLADQLAVENIEEPDEADVLLDDQKAIQYENPRAIEMPAKEIELKKLKRVDDPAPKQSEATESDSMEMSPEEKYNRWKQAMKKKTCSRYGIFAFIALAGTLPFISLHTLQSWHSSMVRI